MTNCQYYLTDKNRYCRNSVISKQKLCHCHSKNNVKSQIKSQIKSQKQVGGQSQNQTKSKKQIGGQSQDKNNDYVSPYSIISSQLPANSTNELGASWYHHQAPTYQNIGDYVCIRKSFLNETRNLINDVFQKPSI